MTQIPLSSRFRNTATLVRRSGDWVAGRYVKDSSHNVGVDTVADSTTYTVTVNSTPFSYGSGVGATAVSILTGLKASIEAGAEPVVVSPVDTENELITISNATSGENNTVAVTANLTLETFEGLASTIFVNVQPPSQTKGHEFLQQLPEAHRTREVVVIYTFPGTFRTANEGSNIVADLVIYEGRTYEIQRINYWPGQILAHDQAYGVRLDND